LADGKIIKRKISSAIINFQGKELALPLVLGEKDDDALLGVTTLEGFGLMLDPFNRQIYKSKLML
jgi:predicted aspartyl protease